MYTKEGVHTLVRITQLCVRVMSKETCLPFHVFFIILCTSNCIEVVMAKSSQHSKPKQDIYAQISTEQVGDS